MNFTWGETMVAWRRVFEPALKFWDFLAIFSEPMAETLINFISKRRNLSSGSEDEVHEPKKLKNTECENETQIAEVTEDQDDILKALEMTGDLNKKLEIMLDKLNVIEISVKNIETNLDSREKRTTKLEEAELSTKRDIEVINERLDTVDEKLTNSPTTVPALKDQLDNFSIQLQELVKKQNELVLLQEQLTRKIYTWRHTRAARPSNLSIFPKLMEPEEKQLREDTEEVIRDFFEQELGFVEARSVEIQRVHRVGRKTSKNTKSRSILAKFLRAKGCEKIFALGFRLRGTNYQMYRDLPQELVTRRKSQMAILKKAREHNVHAAFSRAEPDKLYIAGKFWPVGKPFHISDAPWKLGVLSNTKKRRSSWRFKKNNNISFSSSRWNINVNMRYM